MRAHKPTYDATLRHDRASLARRLAGASSTPYWLDRLDLPEYPSLGRDESANLVVVGGGYAGLWTALQAKRRDPARSVILVEAERIGWAASGRNGGFAESTLTHGPDNGRRHFAPEYEALERIGVENFEGFLRDLEELEIDADLKVGGMLTVATETHQLPWLRGQAGEHAVYLGRDEVQDLVRSPVYRAGLLEGTGVALVDPAKLAWGLAQACVAAGVKVYESTPVSKLSRRGEEIVLQTAAGPSLRARNVALATNGFPSLLRRTRLLTMPVYDYALMSEPLSTSQLASIGWEGDYGITDSSRQFHYYRKTADDRILWGGYDAVYHRGGRVRPEHDQREDTFLRLVDHFQTTFPQLDEVDFTHAWGGMIDMSTKLVAFHGLAMGGRVAYSAGFTGLGVVATRFAADTMLDRLDGLDTERTRLKMTNTMPLPIPPEPVRTPAVSIIKGRIAASDRNGRDGLILRAADALGFSFDS